MKHCPHCNQDLPLDAFHRWYAAPDGRVRLCRDCSRVRYAAYRQSPTGQAARRKAKERNRQKKRLLVRDYKAARGCQQCGIMVPQVLELHHADPASKAKEVSALIGEDCSFMTLKAEMDKCIVLCRNCHILTHHPKDASYPTVNPPEGDA